MQLLEGLLTRVSVSARRLKAPRPTDAELRTIVQAALTAPDHGVLRPWRFIHIPDSQRAALGDVFAACADPAMAERAREQAANAPCLLAVVAGLHPDNPAVPLREQYASVGAAIAHMLLAANALGYDAIMLSGKRTMDPRLLTALGIIAPAELMGFLSIGTAETGRKAKDRPAVADHLSIWDGGA